MRGVTVGESTKDQLRKSKRADQDRRSRSWGSDIFHRCDSRTPVPQAQQSRSRAEKYDSQADENLGCDHDRRCVAVENGGLRVDHGSTRRSPCHLVE